MAESSVGEQGQQQRERFQNGSAMRRPQPIVESRHVVVRDVCAWPKATLLPNGDIVAAIYDQPSHGLQPGDVACYASSDGGVTWEHRGNVTQHEVLTARVNHAIGVAADGDLLVIASGWSYQRTPDGSAFEKIELLRPIVCRSADGGRTWKHSPDFPDAPEPDGRRLIPFGRIERGADGRLRVAAYTFGALGDQRRVDIAYVVASADDGRTWSVDATIGEGQCNETAIAHLGDGRWLAASRNLHTVAGKRAHSIDLYLSTDDAATWRHHERVTGDHEHPGDLLVMRDGRVLLTYGNRRGPNFGIHAKISGDGGETWSDGFEVAGGLGGYDSGYPASTALDDGTLVTVYYDRDGDGGPGYCMAAVRWRADDKR